MIKEQTIGFRAQEKTETFVELYIVGKETRTSEDYYWDGMCRKDDNGTYIFQYTLSGAGRLDVEGKSFELTPGRAFMVEVPSRHRYYFPGNGKEWTFVFLTLKGNAAAACWQNITSRYGHVLDVPQESRLVHLVHDIYDRSCCGELNDAYAASAHAYAFTMECYRFFKPVHHKNNIPASLSRARQYIHQHYQGDVSLDVLAGAAQVSKYHLIRQFRHTFSMTPGQYLTKVRLEKAFQLLLYTDMTVKEVALKVGYDNDNYFNKAFRKVVGTSPGRFRQNRDRIPFDHLVIQ